MTTYAETRSADVLLTICTDGPTPTSAGSATADAAVSPIQDLLVVLSITVGNLGFVASVALAIGRYAL